MLPFLSRITSFSRFPSPSLASVEIAAFKEAITHENDDAAREKLQNANLSPETVQGLLEYAFEKNSSPAVKQTLLQHPNCHPLSALALAVTHDDLSLAKQALLQGADPEKITIAFPSFGDMRTLLTYVRRKNKLYPPDASPAQETDLDHALRDAWLNDEAKEKAKSLLDKKIQKRDIADVWRDAVENKQLDLQRAILLLKADTDRRFRVKQKGQVTDKGVAEVMKEIPCFSPKRGLPRNFNGEGNFRNADNEKIECRHLVEHRQQVQEQHPQGKFDDGHFASKEAIESHVSCDTGAKHLHLLNHATEVHLLDNHDFGKALVAQLSALAAAGEFPRSKLIMLTSTSHVMSVRLTAKEKEGKLRYMAELFDPNRTTSHVRVASSSLHTFETLTLEDFIDTTEIHQIQMLAQEDVVNTTTLYQQYYPESDKLSAIFVRPPPQTERTMINPGQEGTNDRKLTSSIEKFNPTALWHVLARGFAEDLKLLKNKVTIDKELLAAKNADGIPGLWMALHEGHADTIKVFGELLKLVPPEECAELLSAKDADGTAGLYTALQEGHVDAIKVFGELLKLAPPKERAGLLAAKDADGTPGLCMALHEGHADAIKAFGELLKLTPPEKRAKLLAAKDADGIPGFYRALYKGHADAIKAFGELLKLAPPKERAKLLAAEDFEGTSALATALQEGKLEAIKQYITIVKDMAPSLSPQERVALLKYIRQSHGYIQQSHGEKRLELWSNFSYYESLKKQDPDFYSRFKEMKQALKS